MTAEERQFLKTAAWMFARHGQKPRAAAVCAALCEDDPRDGTAAAAYASLLLESGDAAHALTVLRAADFPQTLAHAQAVLETRALRLSGRVADADSRWSRYVESRKGGARRWLA